MPIHETGVWLTDDGDVVYEQPKGGSTVLIAKGGEVSAADKQRLAAYGLEDVDLPEEDDAPAAEEPAAEEPVEAVKSEPAKKAPAKKAPAKRAAKSST